MTLQNRVTPHGDIIAHPARGLFMGNRGILHKEDQTLGRARWRHPHWVTCLLAYKGWHRDVMQPRNYTELFFLDEATALAAGHRPCALCRRQAYDAYRTALAGALRHEKPLSANTLDRMLHEARTMKGERGQRRFHASLDSLPDGCMMRAPHDDPELAWLVWGGNLLRWQPSGYDMIERRSENVSVEVLTPGPTVLALQNGYQAHLHPTARDLLQGERQ